MCCNQFAMLHVAFNWITSRRAVREELRRHAADGSRTEDKTYNKVTLLPKCHATTSLERLRRETMRFVKQHSVALWQGWVAIHEDLIETVEQKLQYYKQAIGDAAKKLRQNLARPEIKQKIKKKAGARFNESMYQEMLKKEINIEWRWFSMSVPDCLPAAVRQSVLAERQATIESIYQQAMADVIEAVQTTAPVIEAALISRIRPHGQTLIRLARLLSRANAVKWAAPPKTAEAIQVLSDIVQNRIRKIEVDEQVAQEIEHMMQRLDLPSLYYGPRLHSKPITAASVIGLE